MNICTHCDIKYFYKGLALYRSLTEQCESFTFHWLCNDKETYNNLIRLNFPNIVIYSLSELEQNEDLAKAKNNPPSKYGDAYSQYMWSLTPYFINYLLKKLQTPVLYADADIYFYRNPKIIFDIVGDKKVGIHTHRFSPPYRETVCGWYNVGVMLFNYNESCLQISEQWKDWLLDTKNEYYEKYGTCGDQRYLDLFTKLWLEDICVFDNENCSHLAPWNSSHLSHYENKEIAYNGFKSPVVFFHFSHFNINIETGKWTDSNNGEWNPARDNKIARYYQEYANSITDMHKRYLL